MVKIGIGSRLPERSTKPSVGSSDTRKITGPFYSVMQGTGQNYAGGGGYLVDLRNWEVAAKMGPNFTPVEIK